jgi:transketolase
MVFSDYMRGAMRLSALMGAPVTYILTHDSIGLGEDGPTHQPVEHLAALRVIPNTTVFRPADANETAQAWRMALLNRSGPTVLALTRQKLPIWDREAEGLGAASGVSQGGYVFYEHAPGGLDIVLIATGSELEIVYAAARELVEKGVGVSVVSLPSWELFELQDEEYQQSVLPPEVPKLAMEAAVTFGWERWVGNDKSKGDVIGVNRFGASSPYKRIYAAFGLTSAHVVARAEQLIGR